jgi:hypothetical protein
MWILRWSLKVVTINYAAEASSTVDSRGWWEGVVVSDEML